MVQQGMVVSWNYMQSFKAGKTYRDTFHAGADRDRERATLAEWTVAWVGTRVKRTRWWAWYSTKVPLNPFLSRQCRSIPMWHHLSDTTYLTCLSDTYLPHLWSLSFLDSIDRSFRFLCSHVATLRWVREMCQMMSDDARWWCQMVLSPPCAGREIQASGHVLTGGRQSNKSISSLVHRRQMFIELIDDLNQSVIHRWWGVVLYSVIPNRKHRKRWHINHDTANQ